MDETHYVCRGGCNEMSAEPKVCETEDCAGKGEMMEQCLCIDGHHGNESMEMDKPRKSNKTLLS